MDDFSFSSKLLPYLGLSLVLLLILLALLIPLGRYARRVALAPRFWIMVNMVCWAACWLVFKWLVMPLISIMDWPVQYGIYFTLFICLVSYVIIWFVIRKKGNSTLNSQIDEIGK